MRIVAGTAGMPEEPPKKNTLKIKILFASKWGAWGTVRHYSHVCIQALKKVTFYFTIYTAWSPLLPILSILMSVPVWALLPQSYQVWLQLLPSFAAQPPNYRSFVSRTQPSFPDVSVALHHHHHHSIPKTICQCTPVSWGDFKHNASISIFDLLWLSFVPVSTITQFKKMFCK